MFSNERSPWNDFPAVDLLNEVQACPAMWLTDPALKYLEVRIDTRDGGFIIRDQDNNVIEPDRVRKAIAAAIERYGEAAIEKHRLRKASVNASPDGPDKTSGSDSTEDAI